MDQSRRQYIYGSADWSCFSSDFAEEVSSSDALNALNYYTIDHNAPKHEVRQCRRNFKHYVLKLWRECRAVVGVVAAGVAGYLLYLALTAPV